MKNILKNYLTNVFELCSFVIVAIFFKIGGVMASAKNNQKHKLIVTLSFLLIIGFLAASLVSYYVARATLRSQIESSGLPLTVDNIHSEIKRELLQPIVISTFMANDTFLRDWIINGEKDVKIITNYLAETTSKFNTLTSFFVSDKTMIYYQSEGILKKVDPEDELDIWYFRVRKMDSEYEINVDPDMANNSIITVFINSKIYDYSGNYLGAIGVGLAIKSISAMLEEYSKKYDRSIYLVNLDGDIILHNLSFPSDIENIYNIKGLSSVANNLLVEDKNSLKYVNNKKVIHLKTRFFSELNLYLFVEQNETGILENLNYALIFNLIICALITALIIYLTSITIKSYQKITSKQQIEISIKNEELQQKNSELKQAIIGKTDALDKNILLMREMNHRVKNNLATIQSLLRIQSKQTMDEVSRQVLIESEHRIKSISHLHQMLSEKVDLSKIYVVKYVHDLVNDLTNAFDIDTSKIKIEMNIQDIDLDMNILVPFALILNELITNAFKYAFQKKEEGTLQIELTELDEKVELMISDNGKGLPSDFDLEHIESLGITIIRLLVEQIKGELNYSSEPGKGTSFKIKFPKT